MAVRARAHVCALERPGRAEEAAAARAGVNNQEQRAPAGRQPGSGHRTQHAASGQSSKRPAGNRDGCQTVNAQLHVLN